MKRALILQHVEWEAPGAILEALERAGFRSDVCAVHAGDQVPAQLDDRSPLVVLGGPFEGQDLASAGGSSLQPTLDLVRGRVETRAPLLGVGFGAVLVSHAAARWAPVDRKSGLAVSGDRAGPGWAPVTFHAAGESVLTGLPERALMFHWCLEPMRLPPGAVPLASSALPGQGAFRLGHRQYGFSFSIEVDAFAVAERLPYVEALFPEGADEAVWMETKRYMEDYRRICDRLLDNVVWRMAHS